MSIIVSVAIPEGIVVATDSRQSYPNAKQIWRIGSDFGSKLFQLTPKIGVATFGWAFLQSQQASTLVSIGAIIEDFRATINPEISVDEAARQLTLYFQQIYDYDVNSLKWNPAPQGGFAVGFHVMGYNQDSTIGAIFRCLVPSGGPIPGVINTG